MSDKDKPVDTRSRDPLNRRESGAQLRGFFPDFMASRDKILAPLMREIDSRRYLPEGFFERPELASFDERVVEYPMALNELIRASSDPFLQLLDVGCVLNNGIIADYINRMTDMIWLANPSLEPLAYKEKMAYIMSDIRSVRLPKELKFGLVTCLSTIEHVGMDNTRYGGAPAAFQGEINDPERYAAEALRCVTRFVAPGGVLLVSVPFGPFEFLYIYGQPDRPIYYTFDKPRVLKLAEQLEGFKVEIIVYKIEKGRGWVRTTLEDDATILRHADQCAASGGVAFLRAVKQ